MIEEELKDYIFKAIDSYLKNELGKVARMLSEISLVRDEIEQKMKNSASDAMRIEGCYRAMYNTLQKVNAHISKIQSKEKEDSYSVYEFLKEMNSNLKA